MEARRDLTIALLVAIIDYELGASAVSGRGGKL